MKKIAIALVSQTPELQEYLSEVATIQKDLDARKAFILKQAQKIKSDAEESRAVFFKRVEAFARARGILPTDFDEAQGHHLHFDDNKSVLCVCYGCEVTSLHDILAELMR